MARIARGVRRHSSGAVARYGGGFPLLSPLGLSPSTTDSTTCCKSPLLAGVTSLLLVVATRTPAPVVAAPVRIVPTDEVTVVVLADWSDKTRTRAAVLYAMDW